MDLMGRKNSKQSGILSDQGNQSSRHLNRATDSLHSLIALVGQSLKVFEHFQRLVNQRDWSTKGTGG